MSASNFSLTTFSPSGKLVQIDYARAAVSAGTTSLGIKARDGVVLAVEKKIPSPLVDAKTVKKINHLTTNIGITYSGMGPDFRVLTRRSRKDAQKYWLTYKDGIPVNQLARETAQTMQEFTQSGGVRPFGVSLFLAGYDDEGPQLFEIDPSGSYWAWKASAIGRNADNAKTFLQKRYKEDIELEDAIHTAILTLKEGFEGAVTEHNIEIAVVGKDRQFKILSPEEIRDYVNEATAASRDEFVEHPYSKREIMRPKQNANLTEETRDWATASRTDFVQQPYARREIMRPNTFSSSGITGGKEETRDWATASRTDFIQQPYARREIMRPKYVNKVQADDRSWDTAARTDFVKQEYAKREIMKPVQRPSERTGRKDTRDWATASRSDFVALPYARREIMRPTRKSAANQKDDRSWDTAARTDFVKLPYARREIMRPEQKPITAQNGIQKFEGESLSRSEFVEQPYARREIMRPKVVRKAAVDDRTWDTAARSDYIQQPYARRDIMRPSYDNEVTLY